ncbi:S8 family peptidase [Moheibacter sediminis]|uniref:Por secretion system C-terminal sorting domain-containing protein n=1 Tax=Moheibacter sediminis TaxID=1434700 RepID=A0A1W1YI84_9FLAO|nr:S8 family peptidase [Moheibacter sediminis]SMC35853.1 Por secretion system C-terminal sorting domain-containing protein [Moheibacter sediminis]
MKKFTFLLIAFAGINLSAQSAAYNPNEILVRFAPQVQPEALRAQGLQFENAQQISKVLNIWKLEVNTSNFTEKQIIGEFHRNSNVLGAQLNHIGSFRNNEPNDPMYDQQWQYYQANDKDIDADEAWEITTGGLNTDGDEIVVAVIDDGINLNHPDIEDNLWINQGEIPGDGIDNDNNGYIDDVYGWNIISNNGNVNIGGWHGTPVSGIIGAVGDNGIGVAGVNWNVKIMTIAPISTLESNVIEAYDYALQARIRFNETNGEEGALVVATNSSWGVDFGQPEDAPLWCAFYDEMGEAGILSAGATINGNQNVDVVGDLPTACPSDYLITVTNMNQNDVKVNGAGYGLETIDLGAHGENAFTTAFSGYGGFGGTSGATPHVAGTIALLYSAPCESFTALAKSDPAGAAQKIRNYIFDGVDPNPSLEGITVTGGRLNVNNAVQLLMEECEVMNTENMQFANSVEIYPNPAKEKLMISNKDGKLIDQIQIFSMDGKLIKSQNKLISNEVDVTVLPKGVYKIRIKFNGQQNLISKKFIKN